MRAFDRPACGAASLPVCGSSIRRPSSLFSLGCVSDLRRFSGAVEHCLVGPIGAQPDREVPARPVGLLILARRLIAEIDSKRAVGVVLSDLFFVPSAKPECPGILFLL